MRYRVAIISAICLALTSGNAVNAAQRMAIPPIQLQLSAGGGAGSGQRHIRDVPALCLDHHRDEPARGSSLSTVLSANEAKVVSVGGQTYTLQEAIDTGQLRVSGLGSFRALRFENLTNKEMTINTPSHTALSDSSHDNLNDYSEFDSLLKNWTFENSSDAHLEFQLKIWDYGESQRLNRRQSIESGGLSPEDVLLAEYGATPDKLRIDDETSEFLVQTDGGFLRVPFSKADGLGEATTVSFNRPLDGQLLSTDVKVLEAVEAVEFARAEDASSADRAFLIFGTKTEPNSSVTVQLGNRSVELSASELDGFYSGETVPEKLTELIEQGSAKQIVIWTSEYQTKDSIPELHDRGQIVSGLQQHLKSHNFALDSADPHAFSKLQAVPEIQSGRDIAILDHSESLPIGHREMIRRIRDKLEDSDMTVFTADDGHSVSAGNVLILTGHKEAEFQSLIDDLHSAGQLQDKVVVFLSCGMGQEDAFNRKLLDSRGGPKAICYFKEEINPTAVQKVLSRISILLKSDIDGQNIKALLDKAVELEVEQSRGDLGGNEAFESELKKLSDSILQVWTELPKRCHIPA